MGPNYEGNLQWLYNGFIRIPYEGTIESTLDCCKVWGSRGTRFVVCLLLRVWVYRGHAELLARSCNSECRCALSWAHV